MRDPLQTKAQRDAQRRARGRVGCRGLLRFKILVGGARLPDRGLTGRDMAYSTPCSTQRFRSASLSSPGEATYRNPFIGLPVKSIGRAWGCRTRRPWASVPTRTIRSSLTMPTHMRPPIMKAIPPNILFSEAPWRSSRIPRTRSASPSSYATAHLVVRLVARLEARTILASPGFGIFPRPQDILSSTRLASLILDGDKLEPARFGGRGSRGSPSRQA
jgi:hypothetical protein